MASYRLASPFAIASVLVLLGACGPGAEEDNSTNPTITVNNSTSGATKSDDATNNTTTGAVNNTTPPDNDDPCAGESLCDAPGTTCDGDMLVTCAETSQGCLTETRLDCAMADSVCDSTLPVPACVPHCTDDVACVGARAGDQVCYQRDVITCVTGADGCLDEERTACPIDETCEAGAPPTCVPLSDAAQTVLILDDSTGEDACGPLLTDPGTDLMFVELTDEVGNTLGWGHAVSDDVIVDGNDYDYTGVLDGTEPALEPDMCVADFDFDTVVSLGCGGWVAVEFLDTLGEPLQIGAGDQIRVGEYGAQCSTGSFADEYLVLACDSVPTSPADCDWDLGGASGDTILEFTP